MQWIRANCADVGTIRHVTVRTPATKRSKQTRADLARAAHEEIACNGKVDSDAIAKAAGVSVATFYSHFASHDDAIAAALDLSLGEIVGVAEDVFLAELFASDGLDAVLVKLIAEMHRVFRKESLVLRAAQARLLAHAPSRHIFRSHEIRSIEHLTAQIQLGQESGQLGDGPADKRAMSLLVLLQGLHNPVIMKKRIDPVLTDDLHRAMFAVVGPR